MLLYFELKIKVKCNNWCTVSSTKGIIQQIIDGVKKFCVASAYANDRSDDT